MNLTTMIPRLVLTLGIGALAACTAPVENSSSGSAAAVEGEVAGPAIACEVARRLGFLEGSAPRSGGPEDWTSSGAQLVTRAPSLIAPRVVAVKVAGEPFCEAFGYGLKCGVSVSADGRQLIVDIPVSKSNEPATSEIFELHSDDARAIYSLTHSRVRHGASDAVVLFTGLQMRQAQFQEIADAWSTARDSNNPATKLMNVAQAAWQLPMGARSSLRNVQVSVDDYGTSLSQTDQENDIAFGEKTLSFVMSANISWSKDGAISRAVFDANIAGASHNAIDFRVGADKKLASISYSTPTLVDTRVDPASCSR